MKKRIANFFIKGERFKNEFRNQIRSVIIITLGFTIAFTWRQTLFDISQAFVQLLIHIENPTTSSILTSTFMTIVAILLIYGTSYWLRDKPQYC
ncbi:hypothetical protein J4481_02210 [Candidatus Pacearchaeota archaeon]|nr:hypothetical protein [Candidatus Pacearchaeota archaeon]